MVGRRSKYTGRTASWQLVVKYEYQLDMCSSPILRNKSTMQGWCASIVALYCAVVTIKGKTKRDFARDFIERINKMGGPSKVVMTDGEGAIQNRRSNGFVIYYATARGRGFLRNGILQTSNT